MFALITYCLWQCLLFVVWSHILQYINQSCKPQLIAAIFIACCVNSHLLSLHPDAYWYESPVSPTGPVNGVVANVPWRNVMAPQWSSQCYIHLNIYVMMGVKTLPRSQSLWFHTAGVISNAPPPPFLSLSRFDEFGCAWCCSCWQLNEKWGRVALHWFSSKSELCSLNCTQWGNVIRRPY